MQGAVQPPQRYELISSTKVGCDTVMCFAPSPFDSVKLLLVPPAQLACAKKRTVLPELLMMDDQASLKATSAKRFTFVQVRASYATSHTGGAASAGHR